MEHGHYVYILRCCDNTLYAGYASDPEKRAMIHNKGTGAKYTRSRLPVVLVYTETHDSKSSALRREFAIKQMSRAEKESLINDSSDDNRG